MRKTLPLLLLLTACHRTPKAPESGTSAKRPEAPLTIHDFAKLALDSLHEHFPGWPISLYGDSAVDYIKPDSSTLEYPLQFLFAEYRARPNELGDVVHMLVLKWEHLDVDRYPWGPEDIVPVINTLRYRNDGLFARQHYNDSLDVLYATDMEGRGVCYFHTTTIVGLGFTPGYFHEMVLSNLSDRLGRIKIKGWGHVYKVIADGNIESSLLLMDSLWDKKHFPVKGDLMAAVPAQDVLLVTGSQEKTGLKRMHRLVDRTWRTDTIRISRHFFRRVGSTWR